LPSFFITFLSFAQNNKHSELNDYGFKGKINSFATKTYSDSSYNRADFLKLDSPISIKTRFYNEDGNAFKEVYESNGVWHEVIYDYKQKERIGYSSFNKEKRKTLYANITNSKMGYTIFIYYANGTLLKKAIYTFKVDFKMDSVDHIMYDKAGKITKHSITKYYYDEQGFIKSYAENNLITKEIAVDEFEILEKDKQNNPIIICCLKDKQPFEIQVLKIQYAE
jgi:hypothetical protein